MKTYLTKKMHLIIRESHRHRMRLWVSHMGHQIFKIKEEWGQFLTETTFKLQISHIQCYHGYHHKVLISIFFIALRLLQSRDYPFFLTTTTTATRSDWLGFQWKKVSHRWAEWGLSFEGGGRGDCRHHLRFMGQVRQVQKWQLAQKDKSADFKSPDLGSSPYVLINYTATMTKINFLFILCSHSWFLLEWG